jgi:hypothetical protein
MKHHLALAVTLVLSLLSVATSAQNGSWESGLRTRLDKMADSLTVHLKPWKVPKRCFKVDDYGAVPDGKTLNTLSIQKTIDACAAAKGGVVYFAKGDYLTGTIVLKSGVMLEVAQDARILGSTHLLDYPEKVEAFKSIMSEFYEFRQSLIYAEKANKIGIRGKGEIYFQGEKVNFTGPEEVGKIIGRPLGIRMVQCANVVLKDIALHNSAAWMQNYLCCSNLIFDGIRVLNLANYNNDGLDIDGCRNVMVRNCFINSEDDAMCLKGASNRASENIVIENSTFLSTCNALKIGTDTQGDFHCVLARNLVLGGIPDSLPSLAGPQASTGVTLATVDGGDITDVIIQNIAINQARCPIFLRIGNRMRVMPGLDVPAPGSLKNIIVENVSGARNFSQGSFISGIDNKRIENVVVRNVNLQVKGGAHAGFAFLPVADDEGGYPDAHQFSVTNLPAYGFFVRYANNVKLDNIVLTTEKPDQRPPFIASKGVSNTTANGKPIPLQQVREFSCAPKYIRNVVVNDITANSRILETRFGAPLYSDKSWVLVDVDTLLAGSEFICWPNRLRNKADSLLLTFSVCTPGTLFVAHSATLACPWWLATMFANTGRKIVVGNSLFLLFERTIDKPCQIELGANLAPETAANGCGNYIVFFKPSVINTN